jgi:adenylate cyclase
LEAERHTFLFTDLVGYTALAAAEGDDRAADVALDFARRVRGLASEHGAEVVKLLGDGLMVRCREPDNAVQLGLKIVENLAEVPDFPPVRVGMHFGPAVTRDGDWYGTTVNVAARLCAAAGGGEVLVSEETRDSAGALRGVEVGEHRLHWLKNLSDPVAARLMSRGSDCGGRRGKLRSLLGGATARMQEAM